MEVSIEEIIFYIFLIDAVGANLMSWTDGKKWYQKHFRVFSRYFPATKGWTSYYLVLILIMGVMLYRFEVFSWM